MLKHQAFIIAVYTKYFKKAELPSKSDWALLEDFVEILSLIKEISMHLSTKNEPNANSAPCFRAELKSLIESTTCLDATLKSQLGDCLDDWPSMPGWPITEEHVIASLIDPIFKDLTDVNSYLRAHNLAKREFLFSYADRN